MKNKISIFAVSVILLSQTSCFPLLVAGGAGAVGYTHAQDKSTGETISDIGIETALSSKYIQYNADGEFSRVKEDSNEGRVLLTGSVPTQQARIDAYNIAWEVEGVKEVINELKVDKNAKFSARQAASDAWVSTQLESRLLFMKGVKSVNYSVETIDGVVYLMGIAQDREELNKVTQAASQIKGVTKVVSYVRMKGTKVVAKGKNNNAGGNTISTDEEQSGTIPGSIRSTEGSPSEVETISAPAASSGAAGGGGDIIIEESPNAQ